MSIRSRLRAIVPGVLAIGMLAGLAGPAAAVDGLTLTTPYPSVAVAPGSKVSFDLTIKTTAPGRVDLGVSGVPSGWTAVLHGGGFVVSATQTNGVDATTVRLDVTVPESATGSAAMVVTATGLGLTETLPLDFKIEAAAAGEVTITTDFPALEGSSESSFNFNLTLHNDTPEDLTFAVTAQGPTGWTVDATLSGQSQAASAIVKSGSTSGVSVSVKPPAGVAAGDYQIDVAGTAGSKQISQSLGVKITGSFKLTLSTPNQVLNTSGSAGSVTEQQLTLTNDGTADLANVALTGTGPTNWKFEFDQPTVAVPANETVTVTAKITPSGDAIAGDYAITFTAKAEQATATQDIRFTVQTSLVWAIIGAALIVGVAAGLWWVFQRYGRR
ncbi:MAG: NEW3 domain-containing protein [Chloroflexota bacterium]